jgi:wyosine [tRNA(Phe)-imidazoG37] synthetase (radical SAM superfamily)
MNDGSTINSRLATLTMDRHDRDVIGLRYVYPVVSRRTRGVSIGINLNPNNACNWRCIYCQVEGLVRGSAPALDLAQLERELLLLIDAIAHRHFLERHVAIEHRRLSDLAISGNGEPTSSPQFPDVVELLARLKDGCATVQRLPVVLITNGSLANRARVRSALSRLSEIDGNVWFKLDAGTDAGLRTTNSATTRLARHLERLSIVARLCPTHVQSCWFRRAGFDPTPAEVSGYLGALRDLHQKGIPIRGVQLYTLARESQQPESAELGPVGSQWLEELAARITEIGLHVNVAD